MGEKNIAGMLLVACIASLAAGAAAKNFTLPSLPYPTDVFETSIDNATMSIHWNKHVNAAMNNLNNALATCPKLKGIALLTLVRAVGGTRKCGDSTCPIISPKCEMMVRNNAGGLWNHGLFYMYNLAPFGSQSFDADASAQLKKAITASYGSYEGFVAAFTSKAGSLFGSGWTWLSVAPGTKKLIITTTPNQDNPLMRLGPQRGLPILSLDEWEHSYYLKYQNVRPAYIDAFFSVINWRGVSEAYAMAVDGKYGKLDVLKPAANWS